jgi:hypothetical protein
MSPGRRASDGKNLRVKLRGGLLIQASVCTVLLYFAASFVNTLIELEKIAPGFDAGGLLAVTISRPNGLENLHKDSAVYQETIDTMRADHDGVLRVSGVSNVPGRVDSIVLLGAKAAEGSSQAAATPVSCSPGYFDELRIPLLKGRDFNDLDTMSSPQVAILNAELARKLWPDGNAVGQRLVFDGPDPLLVVGVVGSIHSMGIDSETIPEVYRPYTQRVPEVFTFVIKTVGVPGAYAARAKGHIRQVAPDRAVLAASAVSEYLAEQVRRPEHLAAFISCFGGLALVLVVAAIYGSVSYVVVSRVRDFGIQLALGAGAGRLFAAAVLDTLWPVGWGVLLAAGLSYLIQGFAASELYRLTAAGPLVFAAAGALLLLTGCGSAALAARRILSIDPSEALRQI